MNGMKNLQFFRIALEIGNKLCYNKVIHPTKP